MSSLDIAATQPIRRDETLQLRDLLRAEGLAEKTNSGEWLRTLDSVLNDSDVSRGDGSREIDSPRS